MKNGRYLDLVEELRFAPPDLEKQLLFCRRQIYWNENSMGQNIGYYLKRKKLYLTLPTFIYDKSACRMTVDSFHHHHAMYDEVQLSCS